MRTDDEANRLAGDCGDASADRGCRAPASAADKAHQQLMAEIRMLQEQQQQLQQMVGGLADTLKTVTAKIDEQTGANRKAFADQKLLIDGMAEGVRILREKADDTNVRLSSVTQELEAVRQAMPRCRRRRRCRLTDPATDRRRRSPTARPARGAAGRARPPRPLRAAHLAAADVRQRVQRLHGRAVRASRSSASDASSKLPAPRQGRRCPVEHRAMRCTAAGKYREAVDGVPEGDHELSAVRQRAGGVLQAGADLRRR